MAEAGYPAAREYAAEEEHNYSATSFCCPSGQLPGLFLLKSHRSTSVPWCKRDTTYCYWLLLSYRDYVVMHLYTDKRKGEQEAGWTTNPFVQFNGGYQVLLRNVLTNALPVLAGQHGPEYLHHLPATFLLISSRHAAAEDSTMSWGSTSPRSSCWRPASTWSRNQVLCCRSTVWRIKSRINWEPLRSMLFAGP